MGKCLSRGKEGIILILSVCVACSAGAERVADYRVVPLPNQIETKAGEPFVLEDGVTVCYPEGNEAMRRNAEFLAEYVKKQTGIGLVVKENGEGKGGIRLTLENTQTDGTEAYRLRVDETTVEIAAFSEEGVFRGVQALRKAIGVAEEAGRVELAPVEIVDSPRFAYRGMHFDVARHFFSVEEVKTYIDMLALHQINKFHWHLTDDQGWRIEIKKYPLLTEVGSQRTETVIGRNSGKFDGIPYGGFFTQEEAREIVAYAAERYITVIPEIDLPGHMQAALTAYPELGCTGGPYEVWKEWGVSEQVLCAGNDKTIQFIKDVLAEIMEIFPSEYVHIGGDECPKVAWEKCPKCQARIRALGLKTDEKHTKEERLQSYVIHEAAAFLQQHGRKVIGWDEILEGGLPPSVMVMSWRGEEGGIEAARQGHEVVMVPASLLYFNFYQSTDTDNEPLAIGGYVPLENVYRYEPVPAVLTPEQRNYVLGVQANLWTEYIADFSLAQYMALPRMAALSELQWCRPERKDYENFLRRMVRLMDIYKEEGWKYARHVFDVTLRFRPDTARGVLEVTTGTIDDAPVYYTLDGSEPTEASLRSNGKVAIDGPCVLRTVAIRPEGKSRVTTNEIHFSKSSMKPIRLLQALNETYAYEGAATLIDGLTGDGNYRTGRWVAVCGNDLEAVIDLKTETEIGKLTLRTNVVTGDWIFDAEKIEVAVSDDGKVFREVAAEDCPLPSGHVSEIREHVVEFSPERTHWAKLTARTLRQMPDWHGAKGQPAYLFVDEITLD